jgi:S-(hydroxymethyl)mycothiol dehydrogenase
LNGEAINQGINVGGFAEGIVVHQSQVVIIPPDVPLESAALIGCGVITGVGAVIHTAQIEAGSSVVIIGIGGVGANAIQGAKLAGARHVIAVDLLDSKLETSKAFGATHTINASREDAVSIVKQLTAGRGADYVFVTVGSPKAVEQSFGLVRKHGTVVLIGLIFRDGEVAKVSLPVSDLVLTEVRVIGSFLGSTRLSIDVPELIELYQQQRLQLDALVTKKYRLDQINVAVAEMEKGEVIRNVLVF